MYRGGLNEKSEKRDIVELVHCILIIMLAENMTGNSVVLTSIFVALNETLP